MKSIDIVIVMLLATFPALTGCTPGAGNSGADEFHHLDDHEDHGSHAGVDVTDPQAMKCEHEVPILQCDACRYEVGAVKVAGDLLKDGLVRSAVVSQTVRQGGISLTGEVAFDEGRIVHVSPRINGVARDVFAKLGDRLTAGAALLEVDSLELDNLRSRYLQAIADLELAEMEYRREQALHEKRVSSTRELLQAEAAFKEAGIAVKSAAEQLRLLGFKADDLRHLSIGAQGDNGRMVMRSPMTGTVVAKHVVVGERISPGGEIMTIADLSTVWIWADVYERDLAPLLQASPAGTLHADVRVAAFPGREFPGEVDYIGATMEETTRTVKVRITALNPDNMLRPGMFADISIHVNDDSPVLLVPEEAIAADGDDRFVFVRSGNSMFIRRDVQTGATTAGRTEVSGGLQPGEEIATHGVFLLKSDILREKMGAGCAD